MFVASGTKIKGKITSNGILEVHGFAKIDGKLDKLLIAPSGEVEGNIQAKESIIVGRFSGSLKCENLSLKSGSVFIGDLKCTNLVVESNSKMIVSAVVE